jgi:copper chaperone NosL
MKKLAPMVVIMLLIAIIVVITISRSNQQRYLTVLEGNLERVPVEVIPNHYQDTQCGMLLERTEDTAQAVALDGKTWFFDDVGCLALWLDTCKRPEEMILWVYARDTGGWLEGRVAWYSLTDETPMLYGFAAYAEQRVGLIDFAEMQLKMLRGENLTNPYTRKELCGDR